MGWYRNTAIHIEVLEFKKAKNVKRMQHGDGDMTGGECCTGAHTVTENRPHGDGKSPTRAQITFGGLHWLHLARPL